MPEPWLRGPVPGMDPWIMPAAHAMLQVLEDVERAVTDLSVGEVWARPGGAASVGFHLRHLAGSTSRLLTYARGELLGDAQLASLAGEGDPGDPPADAASLLEEVRRAIEGALEVYRGVQPESMLDPREVGRGRLPSNVIGLLFHTAEHAQRHAGQIVTTAKIVRGLGLGGDRRNTGRWPAASRPQTGA